MQAQEHFRHSCLSVACFDESSVTFADCFPTQAAVSELLLGLDFRVDIDVSAPEMSGPFEDGVALLD